MKNTLPYGVSQPNDSYN